MAMSRTGASLLAPSGPRGESKGPLAGWRELPFFDRAVVYTGRILVLATLLVAWDYLPQVHWLTSRYRFLQRFFVSSPDRVGTRIWDMMLGVHGSPSIWPYLEATVIPALEGFLLGSLLGFVVGLALSNSQRLNDVLGVFVVALNSVPKIAILPIIVIVVGIGGAVSVVSATVIVFFMMFFNCLEGGRSVPPAMFDNARVYGASPLMLMLRIRARYVLQWAFASLPNAIVYSIQAVVTVQILVGNGGVGGLIQKAITFLDATGTIALAVYLAITGIVLLRAAEFVKRRLLHWADAQVQAGSPQ